MYCPRCGKLLRPEARFCGDCGLELEPRHPSWESGSVYAQPSDTVVLLQEEEAPSDTVVLLREEEVPSDTVVLPREEDGDRTTLLPAMEEQGLDPAALPERMPLCRLLAVVLLLSRVLFLFLTCLPLAPLSALPDHGSDPGLGPGGEQPVEYMTGGSTIQVVEPQGAFYPGTLSVDPSGSVYSEQQTELTGAFDNILLGTFGAELLYVGPAVAYAWRRFFPDLLPEETLS